MRTGRLEAFSDGVLAIIITIMVLELKVPEEPTLHALWDTTGTGLLTYVLSFVYVGIYWNNHHHMLQLTERVNGAVLWANLGLLFFLSLFPFTTAWMDETRLSERVPVIVYGLNLLLAAVAYVVLAQTIVRAAGPTSRLREATAGDVKGKVSAALYVVGIVAAALLSPWVGFAVFMIVAAIWIVPDRRMESYLITHPED